MITHERHPAAAPVERPTADEERDSDDVGLLSAAQLTALDPSSVPGESAEKLLIEVEADDTGDTGDASSRVSDVAKRATAGQAMALPFRHEMEVAFQSDFSDVEAYVGVATLDPMGVDALSVGRKLAFREAKPSRHTVAHEVTHMLQQPGDRQGMEPIGSAAEHEADSVAAAVADGGMTGAIHATRAGAIAFKSVDKWKLYEWFVTGADGNEPIVAEEKVTPERLEALRTPDLQYLGNKIDTEIHIRKAKASARSWLPFAQIVRDRVFEMLRDRERNERAGDNFWPWAEYVLRSSPPRIRAIFLNALPPTKAFVSDRIGIGEPPESSTEHKLRFGYLRSDDVEKLCNGYDNITKAVVAKKMVDVPFYLAQAMRGLATPFGDAPVGPDGVVRAVEEIDRQIHRGLGQIHGHTDDSGVTVLPGEQLHSILGEIMLEDGTIYAPFRERMPHWWQAVDPMYGRDPPVEDYGVAWERVLDEIAEEEDRANLGPRIYEAQLEFSDTWEDVEVQRAWNIEAPDGAYLVIPARGISERQEWVPKDKVRHKQKWSGGDQVQVYWNDRVFPAVIKEVYPREGKALVHWYNYEKDSKVSLTRCFSRGVSVK